MVKVIADELRLCSCCVQVAANADDSGCRDYHGHPDHALKLLDGQGHVVIGDTFEPEQYGTCDGCGDRETALVAEAAILS